MARGKTISVLNIRIQANSNQLTSGVHKATVTLGQLGTASKAAGGRLSSLGERFKTIRGGINSTITFMGRLNQAFEGVGRVITSVIRTAKLFAASLTEIDDQAAFADRIGSSVQELQALQFAFAQNSVSSKQFDKAIQKMVAGIEDAARGTGEAQRAVAELGFEASKLAELSPRDQILLLSEAFAGLEDAGRKAALAEELFGVRGAGLVVALSKGSEELKRLEEEARRLGVVMGEDDVAAAQEAQSAFVSLGAAAETLQRNLAVLSAPALTEIAKSLTELLRELAVFVKDNGPALKEIFSDIASTTADAAKSMAGLVEIAGIGQRQGVPVIGAGGAAAGGAIRSGIEQGVPGGRVITLLQDIRNVLRSREEIKVETVRY